ncbi:MAG: hypothetical protein IMF11_18400 [Proteobacteria bacterium]|nr:hypothetical protein [Pseudomonadota bacterium]
MRAEITINGRKIGQGHPIYIIAEMSGNHNQSYEKAVEIVHAAKEAGGCGVPERTKNQSGWSGTSPVFSIEEKIVKEHKY